MEDGMGVIRLLAVGMLACVWPVSALAKDKNDQPDNVKLLVGKWEVTKTSEDLPPVGAVYAFSKDGKLKITAKVDGTEQNINGIYKVDGKKLQVTLKDGTKEEKLEPLNIKKVSAGELLLDGGGATFAFKRV